MNKLALLTTAIDPPTSQQSVVSVMTLIDLVLVKGKTVIVSYHLKNKTIKKFYLPQQ